MSHPTTAETEPWPPIDHGADRWHNDGAGAWADDTAIRFRVPDPDHSLHGVRLWQEARIPGDQLDFTATPDGWALMLPRPAVDRMEYMLELRHPDGGTETTLDPANPLVARGVFGDHSVLEMPGYTRPSWLSEEPFPGVRSELSAPALAGLRSPVAVQLWAPADAKRREALPLLVAHDGPEYDDLSRLTHYLGVQIARGAVPRLRVALLSPGDRNARYAASPGYARTLTQSVLPAVHAAAPTTGRPIIMGASMGALAALHAEYLHRGTFAGLFLQSGSFFQPRSDAQEAGYGRYRRIVDAVRAILDSSPSDSHTCISMTCGALEENVQNNRAMAAALTSQGHDVSFAEVPDVHTYTAWRDAFDPYLTDLLTTCLPSPRAARPRAATRQSTTPGRRSTDQPRATARTTKAAEAS